MPTLRLKEPLATLTIPAGAVREYYWDTEQRGFGVVVGRKQRTFVVRGRVNGKLVKQTIGVAGEPRPEGDRWTVLLARIEARKKLGEMAGGKTPEPKSRAAGPTLRRGLELHVANMKKRGCSDRSIGTIETEVPRLLERWLDRPMVDMTGADLVELHERLTGEGKAYLANRIVAQVSAIWNALDRVHELAGRNPARAVTRNRYVPSRKRVADDGMPSWLEKVMALENPARRDLQMFCLFTGMRSEAARHVRWEHIDEERAALVVPKPKGGEAKAFTLPLPKTIVELLAERKSANADAMGPWGGDAGWVFPSLSRDQKHVQPIAEPKEYRQKGKRGPKERILPGLHTLRRTYLSVATEAGVSEIDRHVLANHAFGRQSVNATYIEQAFPHLAACQAKIEAALWARLKPSSATKLQGKTKGRGKLRSVA